jgi:hypothetical protein
LAPAARLLEPADAEVAGRAPAVAADPPPLPAERGFALEDRPAEAALAAAGLACAPASGSAGAPP